MATTAPSSVSVECPGCGADLSDLLDYEQTFHIEFCNSPRSERVAELFNFEPTDYQAKLLDYGESVAKAEAAPKAGRQVGKTITAGVIGADHAIGNGQTDILYTAPSQGTADEMFRECKQHFKNSDYPLDKFGVVKDNEQTWEFANGTRIISSTLGDVDREDKSGNRGMNPTCVIVDEAAYSKDAVYTQEIEEFFITHPEYEYYLFSTPAGKSGYFYEKVEVVGVGDVGEARADDRAWYAPHWPTRISPFAQQDFIDRKEEELDSITFRQEFLGEFVEEGDAYLPYSLVKPCVQGEPEPDPQANRYLGVDVARKGKDQTVFYDLDEDGVTRRIIAEEQSTGPGVVGRIKSLHQEVGYEQILIDENAVGGFAADFSKQDLGGVIREVTFSTKSKQEMYQALKTAFEKEALLIPEDVAHRRRLVNQLTSLQFEFTQHGKLKVHHPPGGHDDFPDALALANYGRTAGRVAVNRSSGTAPSSGSLR